MSSTTFRSSIYIKHIPKDRLLYSLWTNAILSKYFTHCAEKAPMLTEKTAHDDINYMLANGNSISVTNYYGRALYVDITNDYLDTYIYNIYNGYRSAEKIIDKLKISELNTLITRYYTFF